MPRKTNEVKTNSSSVEVQNTSTSSEVRNKRQGRKTENKSKDLQSGTTERKNRKQPAVVSESSVPSAPSGTQSVSRRAVHTFDSVQTEFDTLVARLTQGIEDFKSGKVTTYVKFLKSVRKDVSTIAEHTSRISKKRTTNRKVNPNSGFGKPVRISSQLAKFTGWDPAGTYSRTSVTNFLVDYVKKHNLQNPENGKFILPDETLRKIFDYDATKHKPLTYAQMQYHLKRCNHYPKDPLSGREVATQGNTQKGSLTSVQEEVEDASASSQSPSKTKAKRKQVVASN